MPGTKTNIVHTVEMFFRTYTTSLWYSYAINCSADVKYLICLVTCIMVSLISMLLYSDYEDSELFMPSKKGKHSTALD